MKTVLTLIAGGMLMIALWLVGGPRTAATGAEPAAMALSPMTAAESEAILRATVRIEIVAPYLDAEGHRVYIHEDGERTGLSAVNRGLGTLVTVGGRPFVVTHDHYSQIDADLADVIITDYDGREYVYPVFEFRQLIRYRNNSVILFDAPAGLPIGPEPGDGEQIGPGSVVQLVHRRPDTGALSVVTAVVEGWVDYLGIPSFTLRNVNGEVIAPGNSGGGVWANGRPIGSIHRTILAPAPDAPPATDEMQAVPSHRSYATRLSPQRIALFE